MRTKKTMMIFMICGLCIVLTFIISMNLGYARLSPADIWQTLLGNGTEKQELILFQFRLPRIVMAILVGMGLAVSGCILQSISRNPLADPGILGINSGAGIMVVLFVSFFPNTPSAPIFLLPFLALVGALITAIVIYLLSYQTGSGLSPIRLVLTGIGVAAGLSAAMIVLSIRLDDETYQFVTVWLTGSIWGTDWQFVMALLPWICVLLPYVIYKSRILNVLSLSEQLSVGLGTAVVKEQRLLLLASVGLAAACVSVSGGIGFIGLICPHLARQLVGSKHQLLLPASAVIGALLLLVADTLGKNILQPSEIPVGIVIAVIGAPYFLYLLASSKV